MKITTITGRDLDYLGDQVFGIPLRENGIYAVHISQRGDGKVTIKVNEGMWSPPLGTKEN